MTTSIDHPRLTATDRGWLAVAPPNDDLPVGVEGATKEEAVTRYRRARAEWRRLLMAPERAGSEREEAPPSGQ